MTPERPPAASRRWPLVLLVALGLGLRLLRYGWRDSFWGDEAMLALSIAGRPFAGLLHPLDYGQVAPIPFLWIERAAVQLFGANEFAMRALPLLAGCALVILLVPFARRYLTPLEALLAVGLTATSTWLIRYSTELKPYSLDALVALLMVWAALRVRGEDDRMGSWLGLGLVTAAGALLSPTALFVCVGILAGLGADLVRRPSIGRVGQLAAVGAAGLGVVAITYLVWYRSAAGGPYMRDYWQEGFLVPGTPALAIRAWAGVKETLLPVADWMVTLRLGGVLLLLLAVGARRLRARHGPALPLMLVVPALAAFAASAAGRYPIATRLMLFSSPLLIILAAAGLAAAAGWVHERIPAVSPTVVAVALLIPSTAIAMALAVAHPLDEEMRPLAVALESRDRAAEPTYVFYRGIPAWSFYTTDWAAPDTLRTHRMALEAGPGGPSHENGQTRGTRPADEGADLRSSFRGRTELLGVSSGVRGRHWRGYLPTVPDSGWADNEASRVRHAAAPGIWLVLTNYIHAGEGDSLLAAVGRAGGVVRDSVTAPGARAVRVVFGR
jgi:hypothetical protein